VVKAQDDILAAFSYNLSIASGSHHIAIAGTFSLGRLGFEPVAALIGKEPQIARGRGFFAGQRMLAHSFQAYHRVEFFHVDLFGKAPDAPIRILPTEERIQQLPVGMIDGKVLK